MNEVQARGKQEGGRSTLTKDQAKKLKDKLIADFEAQNGELKKRELDNKGHSGPDVHNKQDRSSAPDPFASTTESFRMVSPADAKEPNLLGMDGREILRVQQELAAARSVITRQEQELAETRNLKHTIDQAMGPASEADFGSRGDMNEATINHLQGPFNATARPFAARPDPWHRQEDSRSDNTDNLAVGNYNRGRAIWNGPSQPTYGANLPQPLPQQTNVMDTRNTMGAWPAVTGIPANQGAIPATQRVFSGPTVPTYGFDGRFGFGDDNARFNPVDMGRRTASQYSRSTSGYNNRAGPFGVGLGAALPPMPTPAMNTLGFGGPLGYQPRPIGSPLSPTASDFSTITSLGNTWSQVSPNFPNYVTS